jgi:hypothetical protein
MAYKVRTASLIFILVLVSAASWMPAAGQVIGQPYFPQTGHSIKGDFYNTYYSVEYPFDVFGFPITGLLQDQTSGGIVQYFQRARFELHPENPPESRVQWTPIGQYLYIPGTAQSSSDDFQNCRIFPETGFQVCMAFRDFFEAKGGVAIFGYPISNLETHDGLIVQYFQRSRLEWHPEQSSGKRVVISNLGMEYFYVHGENPIHLLPELGDNIPRTILSLRVRVFPREAVTGLEGKQTIYVVVQDQNLRPVPNAQVTLVYHLPSGEEGRYILFTNDIGVTQYSFPFTASKRGIAQVNVTTDYDTMHVSTLTSFRVWW